MDARVGRQYDAVARLADANSQIGIEPAFPGRAARIGDDLLDARVDPGRQSRDALEVDRATLDTMHAKGKAAGIETRGISDHGFIHSVYFRDPNGYVIELSTKVGEAEDGDDMAAKARTILDAWQAGRAVAPNAA